MLIHLSNTMACITKSGSKIIFAAKINEQQRYMSRLKDKFSTHESSTSSSLLQESNSGFLVTSDGSDNIHIIVLDFTKLLQRK